jgi:hypothetical protein
MQRKQAPQFVLDEYRPEHDEAFLHATWLSGYRNSPRTHRLSDADYDASQRATIKRLLKRSRVLVARPPDWPEGIAAWMCAEQDDDAFTVHWCHVKAQWLPLGMHRALLSAFEPHGQFLFSHLRPPRTDIWNDLGFTFAPNRAR